MSDEVVGEIVINAVHIQKNDLRGGMRGYMFCHENAHKYNLTLPDLKTMKRLARKFLKSRYIETYRAGKHIFGPLEFYVKQRLSAEDLVAFLAAVMSHSKLHKIEKE